MAEPFFAISGVSLARVRSGIQLLGWVAPP